MAQLTHFERTMPDYRGRILVALLRGVVLPPVIVAIVAHLTSELSSMHIAILSTASVPFIAYVRSVYEEYKEAQQAVSLGAQVIPRIKGRWPGNLDVAIRILTAFRKDYVMQIFADLLKEHNTTILNTRLLWDNQTICADEGIMRAVSTTQFTQFRKGILWHERIDKLFGTGLFNTDDEPWKKGRAMARPFFAKERVSDLAIFERTTAKTLDIIAERSAAGEPIDIQDLMSRFAFDTATDFLFGVQLDTLSYPHIKPGRAKMGPKGSASMDKHGEYDIFTEAFERVAVKITERGISGPIWPLTELFKDKTEGDIRIIMKRLDPFVCKAVENQEDFRRSGTDAADEKNVFLDFLSASTDDIEHIRYELVTYMIASRDTTSCLLTFVIYLLTITPTVLKKLRQEAIDLIGLDGTPTFENLKEFKYLRAVINETLRLFPSAPIVDRTSRQESVILPSAHGKKYYLPPNTQVGMFLMHVQRSEHLWGPDAHEFIPERWFDKELLARIGETPFMYAPFYAGPRVCLGQQFAFNESAFFLVRLVQRFKSFRFAPEFMPDGSLPPEAWKRRFGRQAIELVQPGIAFTMYIKGGLWLFADPE